MRKNLKILAITVSLLCVGLSAHSEENAQQERNIYYFCVNVTSGMDDTLRYLERFAERTPENNARLMQHIAKEVIDDGDILTILPNRNIAFNRREYAPVLVDIVGTELEANFLYKETDNSDIMHYTRLLPNFSSGGTNIPGFTILSSGCDWLSKSCEPSIEEFVCQQIY